MPVSRHGAGGGRGRENLVRKALNVVGVGVSGGSVTYMIAANVVMLLERIDKITPCL